MSEPRQRDPELLARLYADFRASLTPADRDLIVSYMVLRALERTGVPLPAAAPAGPAARPRRIARQRRVLRRRHAV